jgi:ferredoxin-NADP reductase
MMFSFERPLGFSYKAGQTIDLTLINTPETDAEGNSRTFSIANAPHEDGISIATRMRDTAFKRTLRSMPAGTEIEITEPMGSFTLHNDTNKAAVFLIGGIGITPVRSILLDATERKLLHQIYLFYSNRRPEDTAFLDELTGLEKINPNFKLIATMTQMDQSKEAWNGETGYINSDMVEKYVKDSDAIWYISGPAGMVKTMRSILEKLQVDDDYIKTEEFSGY